ncbi:hypothetical protein BKA80DRAFT_278748 [Phyllosticta citrichinensis]
MSNTCPHAHMTSNPTDQPNTNRANAPSPPHILPTGDPVASAPFRDTSTETSPADEKETPTAAAMTSHSLGRVSCQRSRASSKTTGRKSRAQCVPIFLEYGGTTYRDRQ